MLRQAFVGVLFCLWWSHLDLLESGFGCRVCLSVLMLALRAEESVVQVKVCGKELWEIILLHYF